MAEAGVRLLLALLRVLHHLPLGVLAALGRGLGVLMYALGKKRRRIAQRNLALCFPQQTPAQHRALAREHFKWLGRSMLERGVLWHASPQRLKRLIHVSGDIGLADRSERPVMWLAPHFVGLEVAGAAVQLLQGTHVVNIYQRQRSPAFDAALTAGRLRFARGESHPRGTPIRQLIKAIRDGGAFLNLPDQDFGPKDADFVPFFGVQACTLLAPSKLARLLDMVVQPVIVTMLPGGQGWQVHFAPPWSDWPTADPKADAATMNARIEQAIWQAPAQYLWVHKRFKTRPRGEPALYD
jgi:KDO2-lipid IV(A) lauroyltransferase